MTFVLDVYGNVIIASQKAVAGAFNGWDADSRMNVVEGTEVATALTLIPGVAISNPKTDSIRNYLH